MIEDGTKSSVSVFAGDTKLCRETLAQNIASLQEDLDKIRGWAAIWQLRFSIKKCKVMDAIHMQTIH